MKHQSTQEDDIEGLALDLGATIEYEDGTVFNMGGRRGRRMSQPTAPDHDAKMQELIEKVSAIASRPVQVKVDAPAPQVVVQPAKAVTNWTFEFERNGDGTIKRIHATAKS